MFIRAVFGTCPTQTQTVQSFFINAPWPTMNHRLGGGGADSVKEAECDGHSTPYKIQNNFQKKD